MRIVFAAIVIALVGLSSCNPFLDELRSLSIEKLREIALYSQKIDRKNKGIDIIFGGLEDYVNTLSKEELITAIFEFAQSNPQLFQEISFDNLSIQEIRSLALRCDAFQKKAKNLSPIGGLHDFIGRLTISEVKDILRGCILENPDFDISILSTDNSRYTKIEKIAQFLNSLEISELRRILVAADELDRQRAQRFGGLAEVVSTLSKEQLIEEFIKLALKNEQLFEIEIVRKLEITHEEAIEFAENFENVVRPSLGKNPDETKYDSFNEIFFKGTHEQFIQMVIALDEELRLLVPKVGGVADSVYTKSPEQLMILALETAQELDRRGVKLDIPELIKKHHDRIRYAEEAKKREEGVKSSRKNLRGPVSSIVDLMKVVSIEQLQALTIIADEVSRKVNHKRGGVAERINNMTREEMYEVIIESFRLYPDILALNNLDSLYEEFGERIRFAREFKDIAKSEKSTPSISFNVEDISKILDSLKIEDLEALAIIVDEFDRELNPRVGGIAERVHELTPQDLKAFITEKLIANSKLRNLELLEQLKIKYQSRIDFANQISKIVKPKLSSESFQLLNFLNNFDLKGLRELAVALDEYDREVKPARMGGVAEIVNRLSKTEVVEIITKYTTTYRETRSVEFLNSLIQKYAQRNAFAEEHSQRSLNNMLRNFNKNELAQILLALEKYYRTKNNIDAIGGVHDYIRTLDEAQIIAKIAEYADELPEVYDIEFIENLIKSNKEFNVKELIRSQPRETLIIIATALEAFERETTGQILFGGIHDNAPRLTNEEIIIFIEDILDRFPQLLVLGNLEKVLEKYTN